MRSNWLWEQLTHFRTLKILINKGVTIMDDPEVKNSGTLYKEGRKLLRAGKANEFNRLRQDNPRWTPNFCYESFEHVGLGGVNLTRAFLSFTDFFACDLNGADFSSATLEGTSFRFVDLSMANFKNAYARGVKFGASNLSASNFENAYIDE